jgi:multisubunit Na+/H+ antiporter MnhC subunit
MTTEITTEVPIVDVARHSDEPSTVSRSMARIRAAAPLLRALILVAIVIVLIMFALPRVLAIAAAASL